MKVISTVRDKTKNLVLDILFLLGGISLFLFYKNMFYLHIIVISLMILMLIKCYYQGLHNGVIWLSLIIFPIILSMLADGVLTKHEISEVLLVSVPSIIVGLLADRQRRYVKKLKETYISTLKALAEATDARDTYTQGHSERVAKYACLIAKEMFLSETEINYLEQAALLHDIGKLAVPDRILHKKEPLEEDEWLIMRRHPEHSQKILSRLDFLSPILPIILYHHRRFDERVDSLEETLCNARLIAGILAVADAFDAMTSDRPYRNRLSFRAALEELEKCSGTQFDPGVVEVFKRAIIIS
ncbi:MAG: HD domain-containing phosphohydrolase [Candidatus Omnitrophota bacterium]